MVMGGDYIVLEGGSTTMHTLYHYDKNGDIEWYKRQLIGEGFWCADYPDETFSVNYIVKKQGDPWEEDGGTFHFNISGDKGTNFKAYIKYENAYNSLDVVIVRTKATCW
jgi:hypothetical protein